jgi:hypothetical protein
MVPQAQTTSGVKELTGDIITRSLACWEARLLLDPILPDVSQVASIYLIRCRFPGRVTGSAVSVDYAEQPAPEVLPTVDSVGVLIAVRAGVSYSHGTDNILESCIVSDQQKPL